MSSHPKRSAQPVCGNLYILEVSGTPSWSTEGGRLKCRGHGPSSLRPATRPRTSVILHTPGIPQSCSSQYRSLYREGQSQRHKLILLLGGRKGYYPQKFSSSCRENSSLRAPICHTMSIQTSIPRPKFQCGRAYHKTSQTLTALATQRPKHRPSPQLQLQSMSSGSRPPLPRFRLLHSRSPRSLCQLAPSLIP